MVKKYVPELGFSAYEYHGWY